MAVVTLSRIRRAFPKSDGRGPREFHAVGRVVGVNGDGSYQVRTNRSSIDVRCSAFAAASTGDTVMVLFTVDGRGYVIARKE